MRKSVILLVAFAIPCFDFVAPRNLAYATEEAKPRTKPLQTITIKVMPEERFFGDSAGYRITTAAADSCVVWVDEAAVAARPDMLSEALAECQTAIREAAPPKGEADPPRTGQSGSGH